MTACHIAFGANLGEPVATYRQAADRLRSMPGVARVRASRLYQTAPAGGPETQPDYWNGCFEVLTSLSPGELLPSLQRIENDLGRVRERRWGSRTLDLDIVLTESQTVLTPDLVVPHPRMHYRRFVLAPLAELAGEQIHPLLHRSVAELLTAAERTEPTILLVADEQPCAVARAELTGGSRQPNILQWPIEGLSIGMTEMGGIVVGVRWSSRQSQLASAIRNVDWAIVAGEADGLSKHSATTQTGAIPAVDCRGKTSDEIAGSVRAFLESLRPPLSILPAPIHS